MATLILAASQGVKITITYYSIHKGENQVLVKLINLSGFTGAKWSS